MDGLQQGLEIAGTGIGVVFAALVSLAVITTLLGRALRSAGSEPTPAEAVSAPSTAPVAESATEDTSGPDPAMVAAMTAAVQFVRRRVGLSGPTVERRQTAEAAGAWRVQGRQALMSSQGNRVRPRDSRR